MTIHQPRTHVHAWRCQHCPATGSGYPSQAAARRAENHHNDHANHTPKHAAA